MPSSPYPILEVHPTSGLTIPWSEATGSEAMSQAAMGVGGVGMGFVMDIYWDDLEAAIKQILGYSYRVGPGQLSRAIPFKHPYFNQLWCTRISRILGRKFIGLEDWVDLNNAGGPNGGGTVSVYEFARLGLEFSRPPYAIMDNNTLATYSDYEWFRYTDRTWQASQEKLSRQGTCMVYQASAAPNGQTTPGSPGQNLGKLRLSRTWYQIPENAIFSVGATDIDWGLPTNLVTQVANGRPMLGTLNDTTFFGSPPGTWLYDAVDIKTRELPMPGYLMGLGTGEYTSQVQYDITFHFIYFNPPPGSGVTQAGHNLMIWSGDGKWYPVLSQNDFPTVGGSKQPLFESADFTQLWLII